MVRRSTRVAWSLLATWTASVAVLVTLSAVNGTFRPDALTDSVPLLLAFASFVVVGALIVRHRPGNAVGWMFAAIALLAVLGALAEEYAIFASARHLPGPVLADGQPSHTLHDPVRHRFFQMDYNRRGASGTVAERLP